MRTFSTPASFVLACVLALTACTGIPLRSVPKLIAMQRELLDLDPGEFMFAVQADARLVPPPGAVPVLELAVKPAEPGAFEPVDEKLPMRVTAVSTPQAGLAAAGPGRRWWVYTLAPESQSRLRALQSRFKEMKARNSGKIGGTLSLGIAQEGLAVRDPAFAHTQWESWLQTSRRAGFFELWSGRVSDLFAGR